MSYIPPMLMGTASIMHSLSSAYESRNFVVGRTFLPVAKFQGDTTQTLTDGSLNVNPASSDKTASVRAASPSNLDGTGNSTGSPMEVRVKRHTITGEILDYSFFIADGTQPGGLNPWDQTAGTGARYLLNKGNGQIYANNNASMDDIDSDADGIADSAAGAEGTDHVVGLLEFKPLEGGALTAVQQESSELSLVIQSLAALIRSRGELERSILSTIR